MTFWAYILRFADDSFYTGHTDDLDRRIAEHLVGRGCDYTARRQPVALAWSQDFPSRLEALEAERQIKPWSRKKKEALIAGDWVALSHWALPPGERPSMSRPCSTEPSLGTNGLGSSSQSEGRR
ncbi:MAG: hypothetical protein BVN32_05335 [Proteobacteria bacterium ST_bin14]|nr:MAG: hypothetical protein BVN32_05335 [Proteobacteria bacterium ST_bin14]